MPRTFLFVLLLLFQFASFGQTCARAEFAVEGEDAPDVSAAEQQRRRTGLREMLKAQAQRDGPIDPRRLSFTERAQMRQLLLEQRRQALIEPH